MTDYLRESYHKHTEILQKSCERIMAALGYDALILSSGMQNLQFEDDQETTFRTNPHFGWWCPLRGPHHFLIIQPGKRPRIVEHTPATPWMEAPITESSYWRESFDICAAPTAETAWRSLEPLPNHTAFVGTDSRFAHAADLTINHDVLLTRLDWERTTKSEYEITCLREANRLGAKAHLAARDAFLAGASELQIYFAYLAALEVTECQLPFPAIVALNEKGSTLHYLRKRRDVQNGRVLLLDSGAPFEAYGSDITRTSLNGAHPAFHEIVRDLDAVQQNLAAAVKPGVTMAEMTVATHLEVAEILLRHEVIRAEAGSAASLMEQGLTRLFLPHSLGHMLGVCVHDVLRVARAIDSSGTLAPAPNKLPTARTTRPLEPGHVVTVEPGIYFSRVLLECERSTELGKLINWSLLDELYPCGGARIEDDVVVTTNGSENLTRAFLPSEF